MNMASLVQRPNRHHWICFGYLKKRHTIRLGTVDRRTAEEVKRNVERLITTRKYSVQIDPDLEAWTLTVDDRCHRVLMNAGLVGPKPMGTIKRLATQYIGSLHDQGALHSTVINVEVVCNNLRKYFGDDRELRAVTASHAELFRVWLKTKGSSSGGPLAPTTVSRQCRRARTIFGFAARHSAIRVNPFSDMKRWVETNPSRDMYVTTELVKKLLGATNNVELRLLLALVRYCGLRSPSEVTSLEWAAVHPNEGTLTVRSPKTARFEGQASREVPIFPEVVPFLQNVWDAELDDSLIFPNMQGTRTAIANGLARLCRRVQVLMWPKPFVNMRASCERDLLKRYPIDAVAAWMGHSPEIALRHYNRVAREREAQAASYLNAPGDSATPRLTLHPRATHAEAGDH
jgi:integrase